MDHSIVGGTLQTPYLGIYSLSPPLCTLTGSEGCPKTLPLAHLRYELHPELQSVSVAVRKCNLFGTDMPIIKIKAQNLGGKLISDAPRVHSIHTYLPTNRSIPMCDMGHEVEDATRYRKSD